MSIFFRQPARAEQRAVSMVDWGSAMDLDSPSSMVSTLAVVPVFASVRLIVDSIAGLPLQQFRRTSAGRADMPLSPMFGLRGGAKRIAWVQQPLMSMLIRGAAVGYKTSYEPTAPRVWLNPERVQVDESGGLPVFRYNGADLDRDLVHYIAAYTLPGSIVGLSPIGACATLGSTGMSTQKMMADWFKNRALPGSTFQNTQKTVNRAEATKVSDGLTARLRNGKPLVFGTDWKFEPVTMSASDAAFIEASKLNATQIASIYGVPPEKVGGETGSSLTYSTVELNAINLAQETLRPWVERLEEEFTSWLPSPQYVKFNLDAGIRVATTDRYNVHKIAREIGLNNIDELRALEDMPPLPDGQGADYTPLNKPVMTAPKETR